MSAERATRPAGPPAPRLGLRTLLALAAPARRWLLLGALVALLSAVASLVQPLIVRQLLADVEQGGTVALTTIALLVVAFTAETALWSAEVYLFGRSAHGVLRALRLRLVDRLLRLRVREHDQFPSDDLISRLATDATLVGDALAGASSALASGAVMIAGSIVIMALLDGLLLAVTLAALLVATTLLWWLAPRVQDATEDAQAAVGAMAQEAGRALRPLRTVKAAGAEQRVIDRLGERIEHTYRLNVRVVWLDALITPGTSMATQGAFIVILAVGGTRVAAGQLTVADFVAFLMYLFALTEPLNDTFDAVVELHKGLGAGRRVTTALRLPVEPAAPQAWFPQRRTAPRVDVDGVHFGYPDGPTVLAGVSFTVPAGTQTALVGPSGAGKSTLLALLERFHDPTSGALCLDGIDVRRIPLHELRTRVGYVEQSAPLLDGTVRDNLLLARPDADDAAVERAVHLVGLRDLLVQLPRGLDTDVGEAGALLSGGQRQRIALARALVQGAPLLLLDEPTSQLDARSEAHLRRSLAALRGEHTLIVVAHRLATVHSADQVVVLDAGRVQAIGTHHILLRDSELYREFARHQLLGGSSAAAPRSAPA